MARNTDLASVMFPVAFEEIYYARPAREEAARQEPLFEGAAPMTRIGAWRAVVNEETGEALAVVSRGYHLVSNAEAFELGALGYERLFETEDRSGMRVFNIVAPQSLTFCHIDLVQEGRELRLGDGEAWLPLLRVTNSYNRTRALRFDVGFCTATGENGVIFERAAIGARTSHNRPLDPAALAVAPGTLARLEEAFAGHAARLKEQYVPRNLAAERAAKALDIRFEAEETDAEGRAREAERRELFEEGVLPLVTRYYRAHGPNAYAVFKVATDIATRPFLFHSPSTMVDRLQKRAAAAMESDELGSGSG